MDDYKLESFMKNIDIDCNTHCFTVDEQGNLDALHAEDQEFLSLIPNEVMKKILSNLEQKLSVHRKHISSVEKIGDKIYLIILILFESKKILLLQDNTMLDSLVKASEDVDLQDSKIKKITDSLYDGFFIINAQGTVLWANKAYVRITGIGLDKVMGKNIKDLENEGWFTPIVSPTVIRTGKSFSVMQSFKTGKNAIVTGNPVFDPNGEIEYIVSNVRDITELNLLRKELKKATQLTESYKTQLSVLQIQDLKLDNIIAKSNKMNNIIISALHVAHFDTTVLVTGESGVGKEVIAKLIHTSSSRSQKSFMTLNCGAIAPTLIESELFGYEAGAFTGASNKGKPGLFEVADEGTLFLDEIGDLPTDLQVKLLRVLQEQEIFRVGGITPIKINVRIIAATNCNLEELVKQKKFREDLYYRLNVVPIEIPPLKERRDDILPLLLHFCEYFNKKYNLQKHLSFEIIDCLERYSWPGNVRELKNVVERLVIMSQSNELLPEHLPKHMLDDDNEQADIKINKLMPLKQASHDLEKQLILMAIEKYGSTKKVAGVLEVSQSTIVRRLREVNKMENDNNNMEDN